MQRYPLHSYINIFLKACKHVDKYRTPSKSTCLDSWMNLCKHAYYVDNVNWENSLVDWYPYKVSTFIDILYGYLIYDDILILPSPLETFQPSKSSSMILWWGSNGFSRYLLEYFPEKAYFGMEKAWNQDPFLLLLWHVDISNLKS